MAHLFSDVVNPLPNAVTDPADIRKIIGDLGLVPYYGSTANSSHYYLKRLYDFSKLSPSKAAVIDFITRYGFLGDVNLVKKGVPGLKMSDSDDSVSDDVKLSLHNSLEKFGFSFKRISDVSPMLAREDVIHGNIILKYEEFKVGSKKTIKITPLPLLKCFYLSNKDPLDPLEMVYFKHGFESLFRGEKKYEVLKVYPDFTSTPTGRATIIHQANLNDEADMYGRPRDIASVLPQLVEYMQLDLAAKVSNKEVVTKLIAMFHVPNTPLEGDDDDSDQIMKDKVRAMRRVITRNSEDALWGEEESQVVAALEYEGDIPPVIQEVNIRRDTDWFQEQKEAMSDYIFGLNGIPKDLAGFIRSKNGIISNSGNMLREQFRVTDISLIRPKQEVIAGVWQPVFDLVAEFTGISDLRNYKVEYPQKISALIKELLESTEQNFNKNVVNNPNTDGSQTLHEGDNVPDM